ncbi:hypothetical protein [Nocardia sp. CA-145437]
MAGILMAHLLPHSTVHLHPGGHIDLIVDAPTLAAVIERFRRA